MFLDDNITKISKMKIFVLPQLCKKNKNVKKNYEINYELRGTFRSLLFRSKINTSRPPADNYK